MNYQEKLKAMTGFVHDNIDNVEELCNTLDISIDDIIKLFPDKLVANYSTHFPTNEDTLEDEYEKEAWAGFRVFDEEE